MKKFLFPIIATTLLLIGCSKDKITGSGAVITETRDKINFTGVTISGSNNVHLSKGLAFSVTLKGYGNLFSYYETRVVNSMLELGYKNDVNIHNDNIEVFVTLPALNTLTVAGSGNIDVAGDFNGNTTFETLIAGSGNIVLDKGSTQNFSGKISGSGNLAAFGMSADKAVIQISGSGKTEITATSLLEVSISGSGNVYYKGTPLITSSISGSGSVVAK